MLEAVFDLLRCWSAVNVKNFLTQLHQFFVVYCNPLVFEDKPKVWASLGYGRAQVESLLKEFLLEDLVPGAFLKEPLREGLVTVLVWNKYLKPEHGEWLPYPCGVLCLPQKPREQLCSYWRELAAGFQDQECLQEVLKALESFCVLALRQKLTEWILVLPLLHLLRGHCRPFEPVPPLLPAAGSQIKNWAGLQGISLTDLQCPSTLMEVMAAHKNLVEVDRLLARSWMYLLGVEAVGEYCSIVPVDLLDVLHWLLIRLQAKLSSSKHEAVQQLLVCLLTAVKEQKFRCYDGSYGKTCLRVTVKLVERMCQAVTEPHFHTLTACVSLLAAIAEFARCFPPKLSEGTGAQPKSENMEMLGEALRMVRDWLRNTFPKVLLCPVGLHTTFTSMYELEAWNSMLSLCIGGEEFTECWRTTLQNDFEDKLKQERSQSQIEIYCNQMEELSRKLPAIAPCLEKCALESVTSICKEKTERSLFEWLNGYDLRKFGKLVSALVLKAWPRDDQGRYLDGEEAVVEHLLTWSAAKNVFQLQGTDGKLTDSASERMAQAASVFTAVANRLLDGNIQIKILQKILKRKEAFVELWNMFLAARHNDSLSVSGRCRNVKRFLEHREEEVKSIYHERQLLQNLLDVCHKLQEHVTVEVEDLENKLGADLETNTLDQFMEVHQPDAISSEDAGVVTYFRLPPGARAMAEALHTFSDSFLFNMCWESQATTLSRTDDITGAGPGPPASLDTVHDLVFQPCYRRYGEIYAGLRSGRLALQEVDAIFEDYKGKYDELTKDLEIMCLIAPTEDRRWIHRRVQQIEQYHELHLALEAAKVIMEVKQILCPQGDFGVLETLLGATGVDIKRECLDRIDNDLMKAKKDLEDLTEPRRRCLHELSLAGTFITWVKEALKDINELKVFVDLASISAGENDLDVDRVACFHDAVLGYAPMLYELKPDAGFWPFRAALEKLWKALKNDSNLPEKLRDTALQLKWLKTVKDSHGSVELSSLSLASTINHQGIYVILAQNHKKN
ncbi:hypothetical protein AAFF_G00101300 [Aldrovandia affinis]|uniref:Uncharacterized protein n=1 Tax=Aldrovandia affinis TaxID=143900 RepID=A0AAD7WBR1_9TELE|nr:hypothetical protein AAFF_G00101300 [Aldrovandia affinis]